ncbi:PREDICTED: cGMP-dependent protein kinase 1-like [Nicrophorus vespilloides]|uniref:cGMP-dependent protein kinase n=1 Tax=Nicrophorus vespilloides TaxID=110193 RepID=A0ABM1MET1_NICVS|nr:PREDICTED: cGMP-dependent protein kinase 1-like [Nicrophorus vespilloides]
MLCLKRGKGKITDEPKEKENRRSGVQRENVDEQVKVIDYKKSKEDEYIIKEAIKCNEFISSLFKGKQLNTIVSSMYHKDVMRDDIIIKQGDEGDHMYVSASGSYDIIINEVLWGTFSDNRIFGELALIHNATRLATIRARTNGKVWILDRSVYQKIRIQNAKAEKEEMLSFLQKVPSVKSASIQKLEEILVLLQNEFFTENTDIVKQGEIGDKFYIIKTGTVNITIEGQGRVATKSRGEYFGEMALIENDVRQATVTANSPGVECLTLSRLDFNRCLSDLDTFLSKKDIVDEEIEINESSEYANLELSHLKRVVTIGKGAFGRVELVQHKRQSNLVFALKYLVKDNVVKKKMEKLAIMEKQIHMSCENDFIVKMYKTYQDRKYLYFLMESCLGGDLWYWRTSQEHGYFTEKTGMFLAACILEALAYLHQRNIVYLDLKPENVLIDANGYAKLTDFGNAMHITKSKKCYLFMGTPEYVSPEVIFQRGYDEGADYWAYGVLIYELLVGRSPFASADPTYEKTYNKIIKGIDAVNFPPKISERAVNIIKELCKTNKSQRLGCLLHGANDIREHKWFTKFNWEKLIARKMKTPLKIKISSSTDTRYFLEKFKEDNINPPEYDIWEDF